MARGMTMQVMTTIDETEYDAIVAGVRDECLNAKMAGMEKVLPMRALTGGGLTVDYGVCVKFVLCTQAHPEVTEPRCRMEIMARVAIKQ